jgi:hypothetical protein
MLNAHGDSGDGMDRLAVSSPGCDDAWWVEENGSR